MGYSVYIIAIISYDLPKPKSGINIYFPKYVRRFNPFIFVFPHVEIINIEILFFVLHYRSQSNERQFLKDFISGAPGSSGARLAAWLQPEPRLDPNK